MVQSEAMTVLARAIAEQLGEQSAVVLAG